MCVGPRVLREADPWEGRGAQGLVCKTVMKIHIMVCGKLKERYLQEAQAEYLKRIAPYCKLDVSEYKDDEALYAALPTDAHVYALDERGELITSAEFARILADEQQHGGGAPMVLAIGGPDGHSEATRRRSKRLLAFGRMTVAHRLIRIILLEQVYRGFRILRGEPYHRD